MFQRLLQIFILYHSFKIYLAAIIKILRLTTREDTDLSVLSLSLVFD